jgi:acyl-coenzyme A thioesterase PaaI-like protein
MSAQEIPSQADFRERAKTNDVPIARLIGFEAKDIADGRATVVLAAGPQLANPMGTLHGGVLCDIGNAAMAALSSPKPATTRNWRGWLISLPLPSTKVNPSPR